MAMVEPKRYSDGFRRRVNIFTLASFIAFLICVILTGQNWYQMNSGKIETRFYPVVTNYTYRDWRQEPNGNWSAVVFIYKERPECVYIKEQIETVIGITPDGDPVEALVKYIDDPSPGSNRPAGWQRLDKRVELVSDKITQGTSIRGTLLHQCREGTATVSMYGPSIVGQNDPLPEYVMKWMENGRVGLPSDYR